MPEQTNPDPENSFDDVELVMAIEEAFSHILPNLTPSQREQFILEAATRIKRGEPGEGEDTLGALVRNLGPRPHGQAGAAARPED